MFRSRIRRVWDHAAVFAWSDLVLGRSRKHVGLQSPAACATLAGGDSGPGFENYEPFHAQSPDTGRGTRPFMASEPGFQRQELVFWVLFEGSRASSVTRWPLDRHFPFLDCTRAK